jgi:hypothetical protein
MIPDRYTVHVEVPRELYEDKPALETYMYDCWWRGVEACGGKPIDTSITITDGVKYIDGRHILPFQDDTGWDTIKMRGVGEAYRDNTRA